MRSPITPYNFNVYEINIAELNEISPSLDIEYRTIDESNIDEVARLRNYTRLGEFNRLLSQKKSLGIAAYYNGKIIGYGWGKLKGCNDKFFVIKNTEAYLSSFFVSSNFRGHAIYPSLIISLVNELNAKYGIKNFKIAIDKSNIPSIKGAKKVGFSFLEEYKLFRVLKVTIPKYKI